MKNRSLVQTGFGWALAIGVLLAAMPSQVSATPIFYTSTQGNGTNPPSPLGCPVGACGSSLGTVDFTGGVLGSFVTITGLAQNEEIFDIAVNAAGEIYGTSATRLYRIATSGAATLIGTHNGAGLTPTSVLVGGGTFNGLAFLGSDALRGRE